MRCSNLLVLKHIGNIQNKIYYIKIHGIESRGQGESTLQRPLDEHT